MNSLYTRTRKQTRVFDEVCWELLLYLKSVTHIIIIPRLLGPPGLGSRDRGASSHSVNENVY